MRERGDILPRHGPEPADKREQPLGDGEPLALATRDEAPALDRAMAAPVRLGAKTVLTLRLSAPPRRRNRLFENCRGRTPAPAVAPGSAIAGFGSPRPDPAPTVRSFRFASKLIRQGENAARRI